MFKLPNKIPTLRDSAQEWADYAEFTALKEGKISLLKLIKDPMLISDESDVEGIEDDTDKYINKADEISSEINFRIDISNGKYPFEMLDMDYSIKYIHPGTLADSVYKFLLFATRLKMTKEGTQGGVNGTLLFERLSGEIVVSFFGNNSEVDILGTSKSNVGGFRQKLRTIVQKIREGGNVHENEGFQPQDDKVDVIAWKGFSDKLSSQIIAFGQCKTGTSWRDKLSELDTGAFCGTWFSVQPTFKPLRMFFCAEHFPKEVWRPLAYRAGLVFDRFRIIDYLPDEIDANIHNDIATWNQAVSEIYLSAPNLND